SVPARARLPGGIRDRGDGRAGRAGHIGRRRGGMPDLTGDHLDGARGGDGDQRGHEGAEGAAEPAAERRADQDGQQHQQRVDADGPAHDYRVQDVVVDLLVGDEYHQGDYARGERVGGREQHGGNARQRPADHGQEVDQRDPQRPQEGEGDAQDEEGHEHDDPGYHRGQDVPQHVAGDRPVHLAGDPAPAFRPLGGYGAQQAGPHLRALEQQKQDQDE